jgi:hypothetical protein
VLLVLVAISRHWRWTGQPPHSATSHAGASCGSGRGKNRSVGISRQAARRRHPGPEGSNQVEDDSHPKTGRVVTADVDGSGHVPSYGLVVVVLVVGTVVVAVVDGGVLVVVGTTVVVVVAGVGSVEQVMVAR